MDSSKPKRHKPPSNPPIVDQTPQNDPNNEGNENPIVDKTLVSNDDHNPDDRISNLPDPILCHIISKLPTRTAVATTGLSTKWKHLFASIPDLSLRIDDAVPNSDQPSPNFANFMSHLLTVTLRDAGLREFVLRCNHDYGNARIDSWVSAVLGFDVTRLAIFFTAENTGVSTPSIFNCTTLVSLSWSQHFAVNVPGKVCLPNLKRLLLDFVRFPDGESFERVLDGCPVLEDLCCYGCEFEDIEILRICSGSLKLLMLNNCCPESEYEIEIDTPELELLLYDDDVATYYPVMNLKTLVKAHVDIGPSKKLVDEADVDELLHYDQNVAEFVGACCNVSFLYLSGTSVAAIRCSSSPMPTFHNLTELELGGLNSFGWQLLPHLLERAPNLEVLSFTRGLSEDTGCFTRFQSGLANNVPACLSLHLRSIYFGGFNGEQDGMELVCYFLTYAQVLTKMEFSFCSSMPLEKQLSTWTKLLLLQSYSKNCKMDFPHEVKDDIVNFCDMDGSRKLTQEYVREHEMEIRRILDVVRCSSV
ncbi:hypothetical protein RHSIM_Rhsim06G0214100 [Rhododendron simsii]|uniref:F-box domain-containing protein n=1 Tax=Rhododendron simsii TaxID=118357 RepID=A0A834LL29_RHOSS|nr:hypothetical protein RHSIM_Rhsim06G0214100 [Rhododendron simsii]